ncbi:general stress protein [Bacillus thuringiensis]|uniref:general stress protein n=1 Tax=Bacillus thuringiensis TaxID=1428 RepID=UPI003B984A24
MPQSIGIFRTECGAVQAIEALQHKEYPLSPISVIAKQEEQIENMEQQLGAEITELSASVVKDNIATGSVLGALAGGMTEAVLAALSDIGLILAAGPIATALGSAGIFGGAGSLIGADWSTRYRRVYSALSS